MATPMTTQDKVLGGIVWSVIAIILVGIFPHTAIKVFMTALGAVLLWLGMIGAAQLLRHAAEGLARSGMAVSGMPDGLRKQAGLFKAARAAHRSAPR